MAAPGFSVLLASEVRKLNSVEGNSVGSGILATKIDTALAGNATASTAAAAASTAAAAAQTTANAALPTAKLVVRTGTIPGGSATPTAAVTGLLTTDTILAVDLLAKGTNSLPLIGRAATCAVAAQLALVFSADPGTGGTLSVLVKTV